MRHSGLPLTVILSGLLGLPLGAQSSIPEIGLAGRQDPEGIASIRASHARRLMLLSLEASERMLQNDAEAILLEARHWGASEVEVAAALKILRERWVALRRSEEREKHRAFLESPEYEKARGELTRAREVLRRKALAGFLELARGEVPQGFGPAAEAALEQAFTLDPKSRELAFLAGKDRLDRLQTRERAARCITRMELGPAVAGPQITLGDLKGKVVLWRSFSL